MKMKLMKNKKYLQQKFSRKLLVPVTTADFMSRVSKSYVPFTCKFPMVMHFVPILHRRCRCRIEFWPHWILTRGVLIQRAVLRIQRIFYVELRPQRQGVNELRPLRRIKFGPPVELWPRVFIPRWIMTLGINSTLNVDPESWFNVKLWPGIGITI